MTQDSAQEDTKDQTNSGRPKDCQMEANGQQQRTNEHKEATLLAHISPDLSPDEGVNHNDHTETKCKGSLVSFKEECELYEIDLEAAMGNNKRRPVASKPPALLSLRYYIMLLALVSPFIVTYSRTIINFAIIDMIHPDYLGQTGQSNDKQPSSNATIEPYFEHDNSCPVSEQVRRRLMEDLREDKRRASERPGEKFEWDTDKQGLLKAAYSIGHMLLQVAGGRLSEIYGSQLIMSQSSYLIALACLSAPFLASVHFYLLFADLFLLGLLGSFMTPSLITLFSNWLTPSEKSMTMSLLFVSSRLGYALSSLLCGLLIDAQLSWKYLFYSAGWVSLAFAILFFLCSRNRPHEHPLIGQAELAYLASKNVLVREALASSGHAQGAESRGGGAGCKLELGPVADGKRKQQQAVNGAGAGAGDGGGAGGGSGAAYDSKEPPAAKSEKQKSSASSAPWAAILTNLPVWAFILTKFFVKLAGDTVQIELPAYLQRVMHLEPKYNGYINSANYVIFCLSCIGVGTLAKVANKRRPFGWTKTTVRKLFQCTASFGVSLALFGVSMSVCQETPTLALFMLMFFLTTFSTGGEAQIPLDLSDRYAGTIHAIGSSLAVSGAIEPVLVGYLLRGHASDKGRWANIWLGASAVAAVGGLVFLFYGEARKQSFDGDDDHDDHDDHDDCPEGVETAPATKEKEMEQQQQQQQDKIASSNAKPEPKTIDLKREAHDNKAFVEDHPPVEEQSQQQPKAHSHKESELI